MKLCGKCKLNLPLENFTWKDQAKGRRNSYCKECNREYQKQHYQSNKQVYKDKAKKYNLEYKRKVFTWLIDYFLDHPCIDCGETDYVVMQFDHIGDKKNNISQMIQDCNSLSKIEKEVEQCVPRCANCHFRKTAKEMNWYSYLVAPARLELASET